ncbi:MAG: hypothetical protein MJA29_06190 [Candidatus Omnitrophica bacterium]|nr:hypothetical protein [Candidatus Omnitrophota bacterium]
MLVLLENKVVVDNIVVGGTDVDNIADRNVADEGMAVFPYHILSRRYVVAMLLYL